MILVKNLLEPVEPDDGHRVWIESIGLTQDLQEWCKVDQILKQYGPPKELSEWFEENPDGYDYFRAKYHEFLAAGPHRDSLVELAGAARRLNVTLLHQGDDPNQNAGSALHEFLNELQAYSPPEHRRWIHNPLAVLRLTL